MILYIAGPMTGVEDFNYPTFNAAAHELHMLGYDTLNPADHEDTSQPWDFYMRHSINMVTRADGVALLLGSSDSKGARLEHSIALALKLDVRPLEGWLCPGCDCGGES